MARFLDWLWRVRRDREARAAGACCHMMRVNSQPCHEHAARHEVHGQCSDQLVVVYGGGAYIGIPYGDGSYSMLRYCPWCGERVG